MDLRLLYAIILTIMPVTELRAGLPLALIYAQNNEIPSLLIFFLIILINILVIFFVFWFLDNVHKIFLKWKFYRKLFEKYLEKFQRRMDKFEKRYSALGFLALIAFVAVPLPGTGAWTGCLVSWLIGLDRKKSIFAIATGVTLAGLVILLGTLAIFSFI